jgi:hypothetical protein
MTVSEFLEKYENDSDFKKSLLLDLEKTKSRFNPEELQEHREQIKQLLEYLEQEKE